MEKPKLHATIWSGFPHFEQFKNDSRLSGIRLNSAMASAETLRDAVQILSLTPSVPYYADFKGIQPRVQEATGRNGNLVLRLNHPISVKLPVGVAFKAERDFGLLTALEDDGQTLIFRGGPRFKIIPGESLHIKHESFKIIPRGSIFSNQEKDKITAVLPYCDKFYLSYVENQHHIDEMRELVGDTLILLKIETRDGLKFVADHFKKTDNTALVAARGDMYIEVLSPHDILDAMKLIISKDPDAMAASRIFLSVIGYRNPLVTYLLKTYEVPDTDPIVREFQKPNSTPECHDFEELAWLYDIGYRRFLLCDEICENGEMLDIALNAFEAFANYYPEIVANRTTKPRKHSVREKLLAIKNILTTP